MTSTTVSPPRPLPGWLKNTLFAAGILTLCWGGAIVYWRASPNTPATGDLLLVLLAAPLCLLAAIWLGKKVVFARPKAAPAAATVAPAQAAASTTPSTPPLAILATAMRAPHGASAEELAAAIAANQARPDLDPELVDEDGFPVTSARSGEAVDEALQEEITEWLMLTGMAELRLGETHWRALTLGTAVVRDLAGEALMQFLPQAGTPPPLRLLPLLPATWTVEQHHAAGLWFKHTVAQFGWPLEHLTRIEVARDATLASVLGQCAADSQAVTMLVACDSHIAQETVDEWAANGTVFKSERLQGRVPGEGAAGLLITSSKHVQSLQERAFTVLSPMKEASMASVNNNKPLDAALLNNLARQACSEANVELGNVGMIVADTGSRTNRVGELMQVASGAFPHLDTTADVTCVGISSGSCGAVPSVTALALAQFQAATLGAPVLYASNEEAQVRYVALVHPIPLRT
ncbi:MULTISPECIES: hypothetical protein [unclassified Massilia]|uniref:hypothetical protein n=1 Tax=unclassified Massilia TaxID=2609279 RepID=UPI001783F9DA|nr:MULTISPECIES: hypothetical protein [unclassified Massilia]MBD8531775.1 hypothetical protein [Massilia sp. CFBP 13647]MBD8675220.1 hypothetical protein [Massilia sp. CFBP 13721]